MAGRRSASGCVHLIYKIYYILFNVKGRTSANAPFAGPFPGGAGGLKTPMAGNFDRNRKELKGRKRRESPAGMFSAGLEAFQRFPGDEEMVAGFSDELFFREDFHAF